MAGDSLQAGEIAAVAGSRALEVECISNHRGEIALAKWFGQQVHRGVGSGLMDDRVTAVAPT
jgi:hypothetical protein